MNKKVLNLLVGAAMFGLAGCGADLEEVAEESIRQRNAEADAIANANATTPDSAQPTEAVQTEQPVETTAPPSENPLSALLNELEDMTDDEHVSFVKNGTNNQYPNVTWGEAMDNFFAEPTWRYFVGTKQASDEDGDGVSDGEEQNVDVVEFTGYCTYLDVEVKTLLQFTLNMEDATFEPTYLSFNEVPQNNLTMYALVEKVLSEASGVTETEPPADEASTNEEDYKDLEAFVACMNSFSDPPEYEGEELQAYYRKQYDSWKNGTGFPEIVQDENGKFIYYPPIDYYDAYSDIIANYEYDYGENATYAIYDIDTDGRYELIISCGTCTADWMNEVFTADEAEGVLWIGTFYGNTYIHKTKDGTGIYSAYERMDAVHINRITKSGNQINDEVLDGTEVILGEMIPWMPASDTCHLYDY